MEQIVSYGSVRATITFYALSGIQTEFKEWYRSRYVAGFKRIGELRKRIAGTCADSFATIGFVLAA